MIRISASFRAVESSLLCVKRGFAVQYYPNWSTFLTSSRRGITTVVMVLGVEGAGIRRLEIRDVKSRGKSSTPCE